MNEPKKRLSLRDNAVLKSCWILSTQEKDKLDKFFRVLDTWANLEQDFTVDEVELCRYLRHEGTEYQVILLSPVRVLKSVPTIGLSFRVNTASGFRVVLIKEWKEDVIDHNGPTHGA